MTTHLNVRLHCSALHCSPATLLCTAITCLSHIVVILKVLILMKVMMMIGHDKGRTIAIYLPKWRR